MKVVFVTYDSQNDVGGVSSWLQRLLPRLRDAGIEVEVHVFAFGGSPGINCAWYKKQGIFFRWRPWETDTHKAVRHCLRLLEESQPDIYVPNSILPAYFAAGYVRSQGVTTIGVLHSDDLYFQGIVEEFINGSPAFRLSAIVAVSKFLQESVEDSANKHNIAIRRIGCGVPMPNEVAKSADGVFRLVYTGRLVEEQKRISEVTHALCSVVNQNPGVEAWIVGDGGARANVERIIQASGIDQQRVKLLGRVDLSKIYSVLRDCHAFILLSDYEGLPVSMLEAMAVGVVPVCLEMRSGIREAIKPGFNGLIVKDRKDDFYSAIQTLKNDPSRWSVLSANASETIRQGFSEETCAASWVELLGSFGKGKRNSPFKLPVYARLPRRNLKFGHYDSRVSMATRLRFQIGRFRRALR